MCTTQKTDKKFLTKAEFCDFCEISESTGYKLMKNRKVEFVKCREGLLHFYKIPIEEAYRYLREKERKNKLPGECQKRIKKYYKDKLKPYDNLISSKDIMEIARQYGVDDKYPAVMVAISTLMSLVIIPIVKVAIS